MSASSGDMVHRDVALRQPLLLFGGVLYIPVVLLPLWVLATSLTVRK